MRRRISGCVLASSYSKLLIMLLRSVSFQTVSCFHHIIVCTVHCTMDLTIAIVSKCRALRLTTRIGKCDAMRDAMTHRLIFIPRVNLQGQRVLSACKPPGIVRARHAPSMPTNKPTISIYFLVMGSAALFYLITGNSSVFCE